MLHAIQAFLAFLNEPIVKIAATFIGTMILRARPNFVNEAVPVWTGIANIATTLLALLFGVHFQGATAFVPHGTVLMVAAAATQPWWHSLIFNAIVPWLLGFGGQRAVGNTGSFIQGTGGKPNPRAPEQRHPMDSVAH